MNLLILMFLLCLGLFLILVTYTYWRKLTNANHKGFGILVPQQYALHGIDVSRYQGNINWGKVAAMKHQNKQLKFAFIKATEGTNIEDEKFKHNWLDSKHAGIIRGAYLYYHPTISPEEQVTYFYETVGPLAPGDFHPVVDIECEEYIGGEQIQASLKACLDHLEHRYGVKPIIYTNTSYYKDYLKDQFNDYPLWISHYGPLDKPRIVRDWHFWQHSEVGKVDGISGNVDFNVFKGSMEELRQFCIKP